MSTIEIVILGCPQYDKQTNTSNAVLAVTFSEDVDVNNLYLEVKTKEQTQHLVGRVKDAVDVNPKHAKASSRHIHFNIGMLIPGEIFSYQIKTRDQTLIQEKIHVQLEKNEGFEERLIPHELIEVKAPPDDDFEGNVRIGFGGDQEILDLIESIKADDKIAKLLGLNLDQSEITKEIYKKIFEKKCDIFIHGGDLMMGENAVPKKNTTELKVVRKHLYLDFHQIVRMCLSSMYSFRGLDDHDLLQNGACQEMREANPTVFDNAINAFNEFFPVPTVSEDNHRGLFYNVRYGKLELWFLNNRFYHKEGHSLLGDNQFEWLKKTLEASTAKMKCVVTPLPLVMGKDPKEDYRGHAKSWLQLVNLLFDNNVDIILASDIHGRSRTDLVREMNGKKQTTVQLVNGLFGGRPQSISKSERKQLPLPLFPSELTDEEKAPFKDSRVRSYYTPLKRPNDLTTLFGDIPFFPIGKKRRRAFTDDGWGGETYASGQFGVDLVDFGLPKNELDINFIPVAKKSKKEIFTDQAKYSFSSDDVQEKKLESEEQEVASPNAYIPYKDALKSKRKKIEISQEIFAKESDRNTSKKEKAKI